MGFLPFESIINGPKYAGDFPFRIVVFWELKNTNKSTHIHSYGDGHLLYQIYLKTLIVSSIKARLIRDDLIWILCL